VTPRLSTHHTRVDVIISHFLREVAPCDVASIIRRALDPRVLSEVAPRDMACMAHSRPWAKAEALLAPKSWLSAMDVDGPTSQGYGAAGGGGGSGGSGGGGGGGGVAVAAPSTPEPVKPLTRREVAEALVLRLDAMAGGLLRTSTRPTLNVLLLLLRASV